MSIGCATESLRAEAPLHAASTPPVEAVLTAGYDNVAGASTEPWDVPRESDCSERL
jgi:hypothetical protein